MRYKKVMVTGGSGLLGRFVVDELVDRCTVSVLDIKAPHQDVAYFNTDILDLDGVSKALADQDAVIHLAGIDDGNPFSDKEYFETNVQGAWNVLHASERAGIGKVIVASSSATYGIGRDRMPDYLPVDEDHPQRPTATYSLTKQVIETVCASFVERGKMAIVCLRPTLIVRPEREAAILTQLDLEDPDADAPPGGVEKNGVTPYGALSLLRSYVRSEDTARCFRMALDYDDSRFDVFNVSAVDTIGREPTLARLEKAYGGLPEVRDKLRFEADSCASVLDIGKARDRLGWEPEGDWSSIVRRHRP